MERTGKISTNAQLYRFHNSRKRPPRVITGFAAHGTTLRLTLIQTCQYDTPAG